MKKAKESNPTPTQRPKSDYCPHDGSVLVARDDIQGYCRKADGWPLMRWFLRDTGKYEAQGVNCPYACPSCGHGLEWDGGCTHCQAGQQGAASGNRYRLLRNHWVYERGPEAALTDAQRAAVIVKYRKLIAKLLAPKERAA